MTGKRPERLSGGFGADVRKGLAQRQAWLVEQGLAQQEGQGIRTRRNLVLVLQQRELDRTSRQIEQETGRKYVLPQRGELRSEEHTSELQSLMRNPYAVFCLQKQNINIRSTTCTQRRNHSKRPTYS